MTAQYGVTCNRDVLTQHHSLKEPPTWGIAQFLTSKFFFQAIMA